MYIHVYNWRPILHKCWPLQLRVQQGPFGKHPHSADLPVLGGCQQQQLDQNKAGLQAAQALGRHEEPNRRERAFKDDC